MIVALAEPPPAIICRQTAIARVDYPRDSSGAGMGTIWLRNGWHARISGLDSNHQSFGDRGDELQRPPPARFRSGDRVFVCRETKTEHSRQNISVFDLTTGTHLESFQGAEGASP